MPTLYAFIPCSPHRASDRHGMGRRGLHKLITEGHGFGAITERYCGRFRERAEAAGVELVPAYHLPWGKEVGMVPVDGHAGVYTAMRSDSKRIAEADSLWGWLTAALMREMAGWFSRGSAPAVYFGGNPSSLDLVSAELLTLHQIGYTLVGDATSIQTDTPMLRGMLDAHRRHGAGHGGRVLVEANWNTRDRDDNPHDMPCVAAWHLWGDEGRYTMDGAPEHSGVLWNQGIEDAEGWDAAERAVMHGLDLWVNLDETDETDDAGRLFALVGSMA